MTQPLTCEEFKKGFEDGEELDRALYKAYGLSDEEAEPIIKRFAEHANGCKACLDWFLIWDADRITRDL